MSDATKSIYGADLDGYDDVGIDAPVTSTQVICGCSTQPQPWAIVRHLVMTWRNVSEGGGS
ncbi:MAG: hypothetical protein KDA54_14730 [Phycisphaerales bacterium]|nr:hypothetical protein [Phycisphaerales bacterium]